MCKWGLRLLLASLVIFDIIFVVANTPLLYEATWRCWTGDYGIDMTTTAYSPAYLVEQYHAAWRMVFWHLSIASTILTTVTLSLYGLYRILEK